MAGPTEEEQKEILTPFTQLYRDEITGLGLALSVVRRIVTRLGGQVVVESEVSGGSTSGFTLRAADQKEHRRDVKSEEDCSRR